MVPEIEAGNIFAKGLVYLAEADSRNLVSTSTGILVSRSDQPLSRQVYCPWYFNECLSMLNYRREEILLPDYPS